ncbi:MAG: TetR/AcrR family transcriptional regulator [Anaerolineales bacterium]
MNRDEILDAAVQIFSQKGFHASSMQDIANAVNLQKASLYHHVSSKQEILALLLDQSLDILIDQMKEISLLDFPPEEKLRTAIKGYLNTLIINRDRAAVLLMEHRSLNPEFKVHHIPRRDKFEGLWRDMLKEGIDQGVFYCEDSSLSARALLGMINWTITWYSPEGPLTADEIGENLANMVLQGLLLR